MRRAIVYLIAGLMLLCLIGEVAVLVRLSSLSWDVRVGIPLQIIAFYGIGLGLMSRSTIVKDVVDFPAEMTSHNLFLFIAGNLTFLSLPVSVARIAISPLRSKGESPALGCLGSILWIVVTLLIVCYVPFHLGVVMPITYLGYVFVSALFERIRYSAIDVEFVGTSVEQEKRFRLRELIVSDPFAAKNFMIGIPAAILALALRVLAVFLS